MIPNNVPEGATAMDDATTDAVAQKPDAHTPQGGEAQGRVAELEARVEALERQVAQEREAATDYMYRLQRAQADFANFKRRAQQEQEQRDAQVAGRMAATLLPALDSFERAFATLPMSLRGFSWIDGVALVHLQLSNALASNGVEPVAAEPGQAFDPLRHESVGEVETSEHSPGHIAVALQRGYTARGALLRPALVQLARAPEAPEQATHAAYSQAEASREAEAVDTRDGSETTPQ